MITTPITDDSPRALIEEALTRVRVEHAEAGGDRAIMLGEFLDLLLERWARAAS